MNLVWHIVRKDLRRMAVPVAVWVVFVLGSNLGFRLATPALVGHVPTEVSIWIQELRGWAILFVGIDLGLAYMLAGAPVLEDRVVGSTQFWTTRPIRPLHLLAAKAIDAVACFVVLPTAVLVPVWLSVAQSMPQVLAAALRFATVHAWVALAGVALASLVRSAAELIFATLAAVLLLAASMWLHLVPPPWPIFLGLPTPATRFMVAAVAGVFVVVAGVQFARRRARQGWTLFALGMGACSSVGVRLSFAVVAVALPPSAPLPVEAGSVQVPPAFEVDSRNVRWPRVVATTPWHSPEVLAPVIVRDQQGAEVLGPAEDWANDCAALFLPKERHGATLRWPLTFALHAPSRKTDLVGMLEVWQARPMVVAELPLVVGRRSASDAGVLRIASVQKLSGGDHEVFIEERTLETMSWLYQLYSDEPNKPYVDAYFLVDRNRQTASRLTVTPPQGASMNSQAIGFRSFRVTAPWDPDHQHLIKVRIIAEKRFQVPVSLHGVLDFAPSHRNAGPWENSP